MLAKQCHASSLIVEDHLKKVLAKTSGKQFKPSNNKNLPRAQHSAFGDFPKDYMAKKPARVEPVKPLNQEMQSGAVTQVGKYLFQITP